MSGAQQTESGPFSEHPKADPASTRGYENDGVDDTSSGANDYDYDEVESDSSEGAHHLNDRGRRADTENQQAEAKTKRAQGFKQVREKWKQDCQKDHDTLPDGLLDMLKKMDPAQLGHPDVVNALASLAQKASTAEPHVRNAVHAGVKFVKTVADNAIEHEIAYRWIGKSASKDFNFNKDRVKVGMFIKGFRTDTQRDQKDRPMDELSGSLPLCQTLNKLYKGFVCEVTDRDIGVHWIESRHERGPSAIAKEQRTQFVEIFEEGAEFVLSADAGIKEPLFVQGMNPHKGSMLSLTVGRFQFSEWMGISGVELTIESSIRLCDMKLRNDYGKECAARPLASMSKEKLKLYRSLRGLKPGEMVEVVDGRPQIVAKSQKEAKSTHATSKVDRALSASRDTGPRFNQTQHAVKRSPPGPSDYRGGIAGGHKRPYEDSDTSATDGASGYGPSEVKRRRNDRPSDLRGWKPDFDYDDDLNSGLPRRDHDAGRPSYNNRPSTSGRASGSYVLSRPPQSTYTYNPQDYPATRYGKKLLQYQ